MTIVRQRKDENVRLTEQTGRVAVIVPAYNEAERIGVVLDVLVEVPWLDEIVVVDDGSTDGTADVARAYSKVRVLRSPKNEGKGAAMARGTVATKTPNLIFIDADLTGLRVDHIEDLFRPLREDRADMVVGIFSKGRFRTDLSHILFPFVSGQRAIKRSLLNGLDLTITGYGVELAITKHVKTQGARVEEVVLADASHVMKEEKLGFGKGLYARLKMYREIGHSYARHLGAKRKKGI